MVPFIELPLDKAFQRVSSEEILAVDLETIGLYGKIRLVQLYQASWQQVILVNNPDPIMLAVLLSKQPQVWHNGHYDITTIQANSGTEWVPEAWQDTFYLARLAFPKEDAFSLDDVMTYVLGYDPYRKAGIDKKAMQKASWDKLVLPYEQQLYAAIDVYYLLEVYSQVKKQKDATSYKLDILTTEHALSFQNNGMPVDQDRLQAKYKENLIKLAELNVPINVNSYQQVRKYIDSQMSDDLGLATLAAQGNDRAAAVRAARSLKKQNSFMDKFDTDDGRIYGKFLPSTRSGRFASKDQNLQQLPRALKGLFGYQPSDDRCLIYSDYSQLELRCICAITGERRMEELYRAGEDIHDYTAQMIFGKDFTKTDRQIAKTCNFNLLYGGGVDVFMQILMKQTGIALPRERVQFIAAKWKNLWTTIVSWQSQGIRDWRAGRLGSTPFGRQFRGRLMTDQLNIENQGFGSEVAKLAMHYMKPKLDQLEDVKMSNFIHDSYILDAPLDPVIYESAAEIVGNSMQEAWFEACKGVKIKDLPMPVSVFVGYNWGDIEAGDYFYDMKLEGMENV